MSFKINKLGARIPSAKRVGEAEQIVTLVVLLTLLCVFTYPMYFYDTNILFWALITMKVVLLITISFDFYRLVAKLIKKIGALE